MKYTREIFLTYLVFINLLNFCLFSSDKKRARNRQWRIPESTLLLVSLFGGTLGGLIGMNVFKHKTKKIKFIIGLPVILIINFLIIKYLLAI